MYLFHSCNHFLFCLYSSFYFTTFQHNSYSKNINPKAPSLESNARNPVPVQVSVRLFMCACYLPTHVCLHVPLCVFVHAED